MNADRFDLKARSTAAARSEEPALAK